MVYRIWPTFFSFLRQEYARQIKRKRGYSHCAITLTSPDAQNSKPTDTRLLTLLRFKPVMKSDSSKNILPKPKTLMLKPSGKLGLWYCKPYTLHPNIYPKDLSQSFNASFGLGILCLIRTQTFEARAPINLEILFQMEGLLFKILCWLPVRHFP